MVAAPSKQAFRYEAWKTAYMRLGTRATTMKDLRLQVGPSARRGRLACSMRPLPTLLPPTQVHNTLRMPAAWTANAMLDPRAGVCCMPAADDCHHRPLCHLVLSGAWRALGQMEGCSATASHAEPPWECHEVCSLPGISHVLSGCACNAAATPAASPPLPPRAPGRRPRCSCVARLCLGSRKCILFAGLTSSAVRYVPRSSSKTTRA